MLPVVFTDKIVQFIRFSAILGFIIFATFVINFNNKAFNYVLKEKAKKFWWLFILISIVPLLLFLYLFSIIFGKIFNKF